MLLYYTRGMNKIKTLTVFCGSSSGNNPQYLEGADELGRELYKRGITLVYGGGNLGLMGQIAKTLYSLGGTVIGVLPQDMDIPEINTEQVETQKIIVNNIHERKQKMYELGDAFMALPGGIGTLEELLEIYTWFQLGYHQKPIGVLNLEGYYDSLILQLRHTEKEGFIRKECAQKLLIDNNSSYLLDRMIRADLSIEPLYKQFT